MKTIEQTRTTDHQSTETAQPLEAEMSRAKEDLKEHASNLKDQAHAKGAQVLDQQSNRAGDAISSIAEASAEMEQKLRDNGQETIAKGVSTVTQKLNDATSYMQNASGDQIIQDITRIGRQNPVATMAGLLGLGLVVGRALRASSPTSPPENGYATEGNDSNDENEVTGSGIQGSPESDHKASLEPVHLAQQKPMHARMDNSHSEIAEPVDHDASSYEKDCITSERDSSDFGIESHSPAPIERVGDTSDHSDLKGESHNG